MKKFYACEQHALTTYLEKRKLAESRTIEKTAGYYEDLMKKVDAMNNVVEIDEINKSASIYINGVLVDRDADIYDAYFDFAVCPYGAIRNAVNEIFDKGIEKTTVYFNTPGGMVSGVEKTRSELQALSELIKVEAVNVGMCCSAGMWLASGIGHLKASDRISEAGSIGVVVVGYSDDGFLSNWGIERHVITNTQSTDKIPNIAEEAGRKIIRDELDAFYSVFRDNVSQGMNLSSEKIDGLKGRVLIGDDAIEYGLMINGYKKSKINAQNANSNEFAQNIIPAQRENTEAKSMKLTEFLDQNPAAQMEHTEALKAQFDAGKASLQETITGAAKYLRPDCQYPAVIKSLAADVLDGKKSLEALETTVSAFDAMQEANKSTVAQTESAELPANGSHEPGTSADGENRTESDYQAMVAADKAALGMGV